MHRNILKRKLLEAGTKYVCLECGISEWKNKKLSLHLDHIDGNNKNDDLKNLRLLCPNCHSLTETYCGKNNKSGFSTKNKKVTDELLLESMLNSNSVSEALFNAGLSGAANYYRIYRLAEKNNLEHMKDPKQKNKSIIEKLKNSNIDFTCFGWVEKASVVIGITPQKTRNWISRNCPEILENAFIRNMGSKL